MRNKIRRNITLTTEVDDDIEKKTKDEDFNFSAWVEETYIREMLTEKGLKIQQKKHENSAKKCRNLADYLKRKRQNLLKTITADQERELKEARKVIKSRPNIVDARLRLWNNIFAEKLTKQEFIDLLNLNHPK